LHTPPVGWPETGMFFGLSEMHAPVKPSFYAQ
jgi:hypothetical protein